LHLALTMQGVLPSAWVNDVGAPNHVISRLNTWPARAPVERFTCALAGTGA
jgi:hypothetical protein